MPQSQAARIQKKVPPSPPRGPNALKVIIPSALSAQFEQKGEDGPGLEKDMLEHAMNRLRDMTTELGRDMDYGDSTGWLAAAASRVRTSTGLPFFAKRQLSHLIYAQRMEWRAIMLGGLWKESNIHLPQTKRFVSQQVARTTNHFFGSTPWVSVQPVANGISNPAEVMDQDLIKGIGHWARHEVDEAKLTGALSTSIDLAYRQGEQVVKIHYDQKHSYYKTWATVAIDGSTGEPFITQSGDYIFEQDKFVPSTPAMPASVDPATGAIIPPMPAGPLVLERDRVTQPPPGMTPEKIVYKRTLIDRRITHFKGGKAKNVHFLDFLCPLDAEDVQSADCCIHLYKEPHINLINRLLEMEWRDSGLSPEAQLQRIADLTRQLGPSGEKEQFAPAQNEPNPALREGSNQTGRDRVEPSSDLAEVWMHYDADGDGVVENIMILMDTRAQVPIYYDHVANVTPDGLRPFHVIRINPEPNRWHGQGEVENFYNLQQFIDLTVNRENFAQTSAGSVRFWAPQLTVEGSSDPNLRLNSGTTYRKKDTSTPAGQILEQVDLTNTKGKELAVLRDLAMQMMSNMSSVANANDSRAAGLDTSQLATGVRNIEASGQELSSKKIQELTPDITSAVESFLVVTLAHLDAPRVYKFFEYDEVGKTMVAKFGTFDPAQARNVKLDIQLELTRFKQEQDAAQNDMAWTVATEYYALPPATQERLTDLARQRLHAYGIKNPERIIVPLASMGIDPMTGLPVAIDPATGLPAMPASGAPQGAATSVADGGAAPAMSAPGTGPMPAPANTMMPVPAAAAAPAPKAPVLESELAVL